MQSDNELPVLRTYQAACQQHFWKNEAGGDLWALGCGLGKTLTALHLFKQLKAFGICDKLFIVAPLRVAKMSWPEEITKWFPELSFVVLHGNRKHFAASETDKDVWIINYEGLSFFKRNKGAHDALGDFISRALLVVDESSMIRNNSQRTKLTQQLAYVAPRTVLLSGTPAPKSVENLYNQIKCIDNGERLGRTLTQFRALYGTAKSNGFSQEWFYPEVRKEEIYHEIGDVMLSMQTRDYLDLPTVSHIKKMFEFTPTNKEKYKKFEDSMVLDLEGAEATPFNAGALSMKCRQFCSGFVYTEDLQGTKSVIDVHNQKLQHLDAILEGCDEEPVLVFFNFKHERDMLLSRYKNAVALDQNPDTIKRWNERDIPILLANPASAGHGLNLQHGGHICVWFSLTFDLELYLQANARLDRSGQTHPVAIYYIMAKGTVEERVWSALQIKDGDQKQILKALKA